MEKWEARGRTVAYGGGMAKEVRQGGALLCIGLICLLLSAAGGDVGRIAAPAAMLFGIGGLALVAVGLLRRT